MTLLEKLQSHRGGLVRLKSDLYWCSGRVFDGIQSRICLLLDTNAANAQALSLFADAAWQAPDPAPSRRQRRDRRITPADAAVRLLIDGSPHWVWVVEEDVELIDETR